MSIEELEQQLKTLAKRVYVLEVQNCVLADALTKERDLHCDYNALWANAIDRCSAPDSDDGHDKS